MRAEYIVCASRLYFVLAFPSSTRLALLRFIRNGKAETLKQTRFRAFPRIND